MTDDDDDADGEQLKAAFHEFATEKLTEIAAVLTPDAMITLVARFPGYPDRDLVVSNDDLAGAIEALQRCLTRTRIRRQ